MDITGEASEDIYFFSDSVKVEIENGEFWKKLLYFEKKSYLMGVSFIDPKCGFETEVKKKELIKFYF